MFNVFCTGRKQTMFEHDTFKATVGQIAASFHPRGMLGSEAASVGIFIMNRFYQGTDKLVVPYWVTVCAMSFLIYSYQSLMHFLCCCELIFFNAMLCLMQAKIYAGHVDRALKKWLLRTGEDRVDKHTTVRRFPFFVFTIYSCLLFYFMFWNL